MAWGRLDDAFDDHPKVLALLDVDGGISAIGLWTLCLAYAHRNTRKKGKVPGLVPPSILRRYVGPEGKKLAALLVEVRLWDEVEDGWMIHDFAEYLPDKEVRAARSAAGKKGAAARWGNRQTDSKLPSSDSKRDGKPMAGDDKPMAGNAADTPSPSEREPSSPIDGSEPPPDSNLPSGSHPTDGKPMASDGSRARVPNPIPNPIDKEVLRTSSSETARESNDAREDVESVCRRLADRIEQNGSKRPTITKTWRDAARLMIDTDRRAVDQILTVIDWCQGDEFWRSNILSMPTLRKQYDRLRLNAERGRRPADSGQSRNAQILAAARQRAQAAEQQQHYDPPRREISA